MSSFPSSSGSPTEEAALWFQRGQSAMNREDWEEAVHSLGTAVRINPAELEYRQQKHRSCRRKFQKSGKLGSMDRVKVAAIHSRIRTAELLGDWVTVDQLAEDALAIDPWDAAMFAHIAVAARRADRFEIAKYAWTSAVKIDKNNAGFFRAFGDLLLAGGEFEMAKNCFEMMRTIDPKNRVAEELIQSVDIAAHIEKARSSRAHDDGAGSQYQELSPRDKKLVAFVSLAEDHALRGEYQKSLEAWRRALEIEPENCSVRTRMEDVEIAFLRKRVQEAQKEQRGHPKNKRLQETTEQRTAEFTEREIQVYSQRMADDPDNLVHAYYLADCYRRRNELMEAIPLFQKGCRDSRVHVAARIGLAECLIKSDQAEAGRKQLEAVLRNVDHTHPKMFMAANYWLARYFELRREYAMAVEHFTRITALDRTFRDVAKRLKVLNTITWP